MKTNNLILIVTIIRISIIDTARISGNFDPFANEVPMNNIPSTEPHRMVDQPSLDSIHDQVHHHSPETNETVSNQTNLEQAGPSLDRIDAHPHSHDDDNSSIIDSAKRSLIQPSIDFLDAQLHGGEDHVHDEKNQTDKDAADLNDFKRWLEEQNQTNQLSRFLSLQKEMSQFQLDNTKDLKEKLNRTIEELKLAKQPTKSDL